jgi:hypothetical protein
MIGQRGKRLIHSDHFVATPQQLPDKLSPDKSARACDDDCHMRFTLPFASS